MTGAPRDRWVVAPRGHRLHLLEWGPEGAPAALFLHGAGQHAGAWEPVAQRLAASGRRAIALDARGHGASDHVPPYDEAGYASDVGVTIEAIGAPVALVGHSTGSLVAMRVAAERASLVRAAVFIDIDPQPPERQRARLQEAGMKPARRFASLDDLLAGVARILPGVDEATARRFAERAYERAEDGTFVQRLDQRTLAEWPQFDQRPLLPRIPCPALVVRGRESVVASEEATAEAVRLLPRGESAILPGAHLLHMQHPDVCAEALEAFLARAGA
ncbi:MAG: alpha/beta hydrolase [Chloroflexota bacterium]